MLRRIHKLFPAAFAAVIFAASVSSCIDSDTPPADVKGVFVEFEAEGQKKATINTYDRTVAVDLLETVNPAEVKISRMVLPEGGVCSDAEGNRIAAGSIVDLSSPLKVKITTFADYEWTISSTQTIERIFEIEDQVGTSVFEDNSYSVFAYVPAGTDMTQIKVDKIKLGPGTASDGITVMTPDLNGQTVSFKESTSGDIFRVREVKVEYRGKTETWSLYVAQTASGINEVPRSNVWATFATVTARVLEAGAENVEFGWREAGAETWQYVPAVSDGAYGYSARITGLEPATEYEVSLSLGGEIVDGTAGFTTEAATQPRNPGFEDYGYDASSGNKIGYYFYKNEADKFWDCGNKGAMTLNKSVTTPSPDVRQGSPGISSAYLKSQFVGVVGIGKFAAGNMYSGDYAGTNGTNGYIDFGQPFTSRPTSLSFWYKANAGEVDYSGGGGLSKKDTDKYRVFIALTDWGEKKQIYTGDTDTFIDWYTDPGIIAFGEIISSDAVAEWTRRTIDLKYLSTERIPTHIVIVASASMLGDYFTGSTASWMYLDDVELIYNDRIVLQD